MIPSTIDAPAHCPPPQDDPITLPVKFTQVVHEKDINSIAVSPNDKLVVTGSQDKTAKVGTCSMGCVLSLAVL